MARQIPVSRVNANFAISDWVSALKPARMLGKGIITCWIILKRIRDRVWCVCVRAMSACEGRKLLSSHCSSNRIDYVSGSARHKLIYDDPELPCLELTRTVIFIIEGLTPND